MAEAKLNIMDFIPDYYDFADSVQAYEDLLSRKILRKGIVKLI